MRKQAEEALRLLESDLPKELSLIEVYFVGSAVISKLHGEFLQDPTPTDVITFEHGEIFICPAVAEQQRSMNRLSLEDELLTYVIHGLLHLCGWDDHDPEDYDRMHLQQNRLLKKIRKG